jgi:glycerol-3-phosphate acyltransferase PlsY
VTEVSIFYPLLLAYLIGSVPFGLIISRFYGTDITKTGSGNIGATNVFRTVGLFAGILVLFADIAKGFLAIQVVHLLAGSYGQGQIISVLAAVFVVLGHSFSPFMRMSGGKGVATAAGALIALLPIIAVVLIFMWIFILIFTRYVSVASLTAAFLFPFLTIITKRSLPNVVLSLVVCLIIFYTHRSNIKRLLKGEEYKFQWNKR